MTCRALVLPLSLLALGACSRSPSEPATTTSTPPSSTAAPSSAPTASTPTPAPPAIAMPAPHDFPLLWNDPPHFVRSPPRSPARAAQYVVPRVGSDSEDAECVVMTFGPHQGGTVDENAKRWVDQFHPALPTPRRMTTDVNGMHVTFVEVTGTFAGNMMPNAQNIVAPSNKPGWRLIGAIVESPSGLWFFKMTGPDVTVRSGAREFEDMVRSARPR